MKKNKLRENVLSYNKIDVFLEALDSSEGFTTREEANALDDIEYEWDEDEEEVSDVLISFNYINETIKKYVKNFEKKNNETSVHDKSKITQILLRGDSNDDIIINFYREETNKEFVARLEHLKQSIKNKAERIAITQKAVATRKRNNVMVEKLRRELINAKTAFKRESIYQSYYEQYSNKSSHRRIMNVSSQFEYYPYYFKKGRIYKGWY